MRPAHSFGPGRSAFHNLEHAREDPAVEFVAETGAIVEVVGCEREEPGLFGGRMGTFAFADGRRPQQQGQYIARACERWPRSTAAGASLSTDVHEDAGDSMILPAAKPRAAATMASAITMGGRTEAAYQQAQIVVTSTDTRSSFVPGPR